MMIGQLGWEKIILISLLNIWRLCCVETHMRQNSTTENRLESFFSIARRSLGKGRLRGIPHNKIKYQSLLTFY